MNTTAEKPLRLFFGIKPDPSQQQAITSLRRTLARPGHGRPVAVDNIHLTLAFLGDTPASLLPELCRQADGIEAAAFDLALTRPGWFKRSQVLWLAPETLPTALSNLARDLRQIAAALGLHQEHKPFRPHLTLYRKVRQLPDWPETLPGLHWTCRQFSLFQSINQPDGVHYQALGHWPLNSSPSSVV